MRDSALAMTAALLRVGHDKDWEVDAVGTSDGRVLLIKEGTEVVIGEVHEVGDVTMFSKPRLLSEFSIEEAA